MIEPEGLRGLLLSTGLELVPVENERQRGQKPEARLAGALSVYIQGLLPSGKLPAYTLSALQARAVVELLAPGWSMHTVKLMALDYVSKRQPLLVRDMRQLADTKKALQQIEFVLYALTALQPAPDVNVFMSTREDGVPVYNPDAAMSYQVTLTEAWHNMPLRDEPPATLS